MDIDYRNGGKPRRSLRRLVGLLRERYKLWRLCRKHGITIPHVTVAPGATEEDVFKALQKTFKNGMPKGKEIKLDEIL